MNRGRDEVVACWATVARPGVCAEWLAWPCVATGRRGRGRGLGRNARHRTRRSARPVALAGQPAATQGLEKLKFLAVGPTKKSLSTDEPSGADSSGLAIRAWRIMVVLASPP